MSSTPTSGRPARPDEVEPSDAMREADRANGEPETTQSGDEPEPNEQEKEREVNAHLGPGDPAEGYRPCHHGEAVPYARDRGDVDRPRSA